MVLAVGPLSWFLFVLGIATKTLKQLCCQAMTHTADMSGKNRSVLLAPDLLEHGGSWVS
jgi:hypothetical protein